MFVKNEEETVSEYFLWIKNELFKSGKEGTVHFFRAYLLCSHDFVSPVFKSSYERIFYCSDGPLADWG